MRPPGLPDAESGLRRARIISQSAARLGAGTLTGVDGDWVTTGDLIEPSIEFLQRNLEEPFRTVIRTRPHCRPKAVSANF